MPTPYLEVAREDIFQSPNGGNRPNVPDILILITDGIPGIRVRDTIPEADRTKDANIFIISVSVTADVLIETLLQISSNNVVLTVTDFTALNSLLESLAQRTCEAGEYEVVYAFI